ncbi:hypothetical protein [Streptomyces lydicus]|uniref:hypothetical protein n=1 Tax=Streptomyces lydicus TaxID=47763 RepID=UPI00378A2825
MNGAQRVAGLGAEDLQRLETGKTGDTEEERHAYGPCAQLRGHVEAPALGATVEEDTQVPEHDDGDLDARARKVPRR